MPEIKIDIAFYRYNYHEDLVRDLEPIYSATANDSIFFTIDLNTPFIYGDYLVLLISAVNYLKSAGILYDGVFIQFNKQSQVVQYASRIDFFKQLGVPLPEPFIRADGAGRFTEIINYHDAQSALEVNKKIINILKGSSAINISVLKMLDYCLYEVLDNVLTHAQSPTNGIVVTQLFPQRKSIRLIICDTGIGIYDALAKTEGSKYQHITPQQAIVLCTNKGVTNGLGMGNGLFHTSEFIKHNNGTFVLHSGNYIYKIVGGKQKVYHTNYWRGVYLYMNIAKQ